MGPAVSWKKKEPAPAPTPSQTVYSPGTVRWIDFAAPAPTGFAVPATTTPLNVGAPIPPKQTHRPPLVQPSSPSPNPAPQPTERIRLPRLLPAHQWTRSSPGRNIKVLPMLVDGITQEIREWRISADRNTEVLEENTRELRGQRGDMREMMDMMRSNADVVRENMSELWRTRMEQERRTDYGDRSKRLYYGGSQSSYGSQGGWEM